MSSTEGTPSSAGSSNHQESRSQNGFAWPGNRPAAVSSKGPQKIRVTILCARSLVKRDIFRLPDPFVKVHVDGSGQSHMTEVSKNTLDPKWNVHYDLFVGLNDTITISVWNDKKVNSEKKKISSRVKIMIIFSPADQQRWERCGIPRLRTSFE